jgi:uncharacterized membrane protein YdbT with pleckstrin-like domain
MTDEDTPTGGDASQSVDEVPEWLSLDDDEEIEWMGEPVPISIVGTAIWGLILTVVLIGFLILLTLPLSWLSIKNTDYVITNKSLYVKKGVMSTNIESVGLDKIQNTEFSQSIWGTQFGYGSIEISTAGSSGAEISFQNIQDAGSVRETINTLGNEYTSGSSRSETTADGTAAATGTTGAGMDDLIDELRGTRQALERVERRLSEEADANAEPDSPAADETD